MVIDQETCISCCSCVNTCPVGAIALNEAGKAEINQDKCIKCGACKDSCPVDAIKE
ncbi:MAG: 4Fe-4S dicluster domain-containing protein [Clostridiales bacterium]|nr:4Fe-4S dicluster domain-containing protein [Clostridiales bacterium]